MNILLTSAGRRVYLVEYFKEVLKETGQVHASNSKWTTALEAADKGVITPLIYEDDYITFLLEYCKKNKIRAVLSLFDIDLPILAQHKSRFKEAGIDVVVSDVEVIGICNDKWRTYQFLKKIGINTPKTFLTKQEAIQKIAEHKLKFPLMVKPRWGMGSISIFKAENPDELHVFYEKVKREVHDSYLKYESRIDPERAVIIQEHVQGQEYGLDIINDLKKNYVTTLVKQKSEMRSGETAGAKTVYNEVLERTGEKIAKNLKHIANLDSDCFLVDGEVFVLEMNCRFGGGYPFSHIAGANLPAAIVAWLNGKSGDSFFQNYQIGIEGKKCIAIKKMKLSS